MKKNKVRGMIIVVLVLIILIIVALIWILTWQRENTRAIPELSEEGIQPNQSIQKVQSKDDIITVENMVNTYFRAINDKEITKIRNIVDQEYLSYYNISDSVISSQFRDITNYQFYANEVYSYEETYLKVGYFVYGILTDNVQDIGYPFYIMVKADYDKQSFSIVPYEKNLIKVDKMPQQQELLELENRLGLERQIATTLDNQIIRKVQTNEEIARWLIEHYKVNALYNTEYTYENMLESQYKEKRFGDLENYKKYIQSMQEKIKLITPVKYQINNKERGKEYIIQDNYNVYYTIRITDNMDYSIMLDNYTIPSEELIKQYEKADQNTKVMTHLDTFLHMLNAKDFKHAYDLLDIGFKQNYFPTQQQFENYIQENFFSYNIISAINENRVEGEIFVYNLTIKSSTGAGAEQKEKRFLVKLTDNNSCVMSFEV